MARGDWIKLHRKLLEGPIFQHDGLFRLWCYCLMRANWKETTWIMPGTMTRIDIPRGSFITGKHSLHEDLYKNHDEREMPAPSTSTLWRWLGCLQSLGCLKLQNMNNRCTLVSICKYGTYQDDKQEYETQVNHRRTADETPVNHRRNTGEPLMNTEEELKKEKKERKKEEAAAPLPFLSPEFSQAWAKWQKFRKEKRQPVTPTMAEAQLKMLAKIGHDRAVRMIEHTMAMGWQGLREPEANFHATQTPESIYPEL